MKKLFSFIIITSAVLAMAFPCLAFGTVTGIDAPYEVMYYVYNDGDNERVIISCLLSDELAALSAGAGNGITSANTYVQVDYRIDGGEWQYTAQWDTSPDLCKYSQLTDKGATVVTLDLMYLTNASAVEDAGVLANTLTSGERVFDLENHSLEIRLRTALVYYSTGSYIVNSDWTETIAVERKQAPELPTELEAPGVSNLQVHYSDEEAPTLTFDVKTPESVKKAQAMYRTYVPAGIQLKCYVDYGEGWTDTSMSSSGGYFSNETKTLRFSNADFDDQKLFKVRLVYLVYDSNDNAIYSPESEELRAQVPRWVEGKGVLGAKCTTCGICTQVFGQCMFIVFGVAAAVLIVAAIIAKIQLDKVKARKAKAEAERQRRLEEEKRKYDELKKAKKEKNKKAK